MQTVEEVKNFVKNCGNDDRYSGGAQHFGESLSWRDAKTPVDVDGVNFYVVDGKFGQEGEGENIWIVFHVEGYDTLYRMSGFYSSYDGSEWSAENIEEVESRPKVIQEYFAVKK